MVVYKIFFRDGDFRNRDRAPSIVPLQFARNSAKAVRQMADIVVKTLQTNPPIYEGGGLRVELSEPRMPPMTIVFYASDPSRNRWVLERDAISFLPADPKFPDFVVHE